MADSLSQAEKDSLIAHFSEMTGSGPQTAEDELRDNNWNLEEAVENFLNNAEQEAEEDSSATASNTGPRTLGGAPVPQTAPTASSSGPSSQPSGSKKKFATLGDLAKSNPGHGHAHDHDDDDDDDDQDLFAGGEKSGLAVQNPDDLKRKLLEKARKAAPRPEAEENQPRQSAFRGTARTLGGDDTPSEVVEDPEANTPRPPERVERVLHFWSNGFSIDDGPLYDTSDSRNAVMLEMIRRGRAPLTLMNIQMDQEVDVRLEEHDTPYQQPKKKYKPFGGSGQRLGSPTPGAVSSAPPPPPTVPTTSSSVTTSRPATVEIDDSQPVVSLQIRLGDGTRLVSRFNTSSTIEDVYNFVRASNAESQTRNWTLMTTFPSKELSDKSLKLEDSSELKKGGVVVQKWA